MNVEVRSRIRAPTRVGIVDCDIHPRPARAAAAVSEQPLVGLSADLWQASRHGYSPAIRPEDDAARGAARRLAARWRRPRERPRLLRKQHLDRYGIAMGS